MKPVKDKPNSLSVIPIAEVKNFEDWDLFQRFQFFPVLLLC
jgi:hypothetical protein